MRGKGHFNRVPTGLVGMALRGNRHKPDLWKRLMPSAKAKLVQQGLFTTDGQITELGKTHLASLEKKDG